MASAVRDEVATILDQLFGVPADALADDVTLADGLQLDSLSVVELQMAIEDHFGIRLDAPRDGAGGEVTDVETFGQLVDAVQLALADEARSA